MIQPPQTPDFVPFRRRVAALWPDLINLAHSSLRSLSPSMMQQSLAHPDGFLKLSIGSGRGYKDGQIRLHFWLPGRPTSLQPHSHPWHLASTILYGRYEQYHPTISSSPAGEYSRFRVHYDSGSDHRLKTTQDAGKYVIEQGELQTLFAGHQYYLPAGQAHTSLPSANGTITLCVMSPRFETSAVYYATTADEYDSSVAETDVDHVMTLVAAYEIAQSLA